MNETEKQNAIENLKKEIKSKFKDYISTTYEIPSLEEFCVDNGYITKIDVIESAEWFEEERLILKAKRKIFLEKKRINSKEGLEEALSNEYGDENANIMILDIQGVGIRKDIQEKIEEERRRRKANRK